MIGSVDFATSYRAGLSGGVQQRVGIARACQQPKRIADERALRRARRTPPPRYDARKSAALVGRVGHDGPGRDISTSLESIAINRQCLDLITPRPHAEFERKVCASSRSKTMPRVVFLADDPHATSRWLSPTPAISAADLSASAGLSMLSRCSSTVSATMSIARRWTRLSRWFISQRSMSSTHLVHHRDYAAALRTDGNG